MKSRDYDSDLIHKLFCERLFVADDFDCMGHLCNMCLIDHFCTESIIMVDDENG